ncbi:MAG: hypothetical protein HY269_01635 [Deltaproteobacteria bacterium]|nr:hypothetical protein [Deltaproteobacteria bacterium]
MSTKVTEIAAANLPQQLEIHDDARLLTDNSDFVIFIARQESQLLAPKWALHSF